MKILSKRAAVAALLGAFVVVGGGVLPPPAEAGGFGKALFSRALKGGVKGQAARSAKPVTQQMLKREAARDAATAAKPLAAPRTVHRYTTAERAAQEAKHGLKPGTHMAPNARSGRPLTADNARDRYGLPTRPEVRETIVLPKGHPVRHNRALYGQPGWGELTSPKALPPDAVRRVVPLPR